MLKILLGIIFLINICGIVLAENLEGLQNKKNELQTQINESNKQIEDIEIEITDRNKFKEFFHKVRNKSEDLLFSIIQKLPERFIPSFIMEWLDRYTDRRINELKHQQIKATWQKMYLQSAVNQIHKNEAPTEE